MKLLFIGPENVCNDLRAAVPLAEVRHSQQPTNDCENYHAVFDALFDERHELPNGFIYPTTHLLVGAAVKRKAAESLALLKRHVASPVVGMNLLPTFVGAKTKEVAAVDEEAEKRFAALALTWQWSFKWMSDSVGMVTPRVLAMIVNEAAHTLEENTATKEDIDRGMELGTGYPQGPLKWCDAVGIGHVTDLLQALHETTGDERYRTAPLLLRMRQARQTFY